LPPTRFQACGLSPPQFKEVRDLDRQSRVVCAERLRT